MAGALAPTPLGLTLGPQVVSAGFVLGEHEAVVAELSALAPPGFPERAVAKRKAEFLAGRFAAQQALAELGVQAMPGRNEDGCASWPSEVVGSITHGARRALCAVSPRSALRSLGIDAEALMAESVSQELRARIASSSEREQLARDLAAPDHELVTLAFSAKESLYKCLYPLAGKFMDFSAARVITAFGAVEAAGLRGELTLELATDWSDELPKGRRFQAPFLLAASHVETAVLLSV